MDGLVEPIYINTPFAGLASLLFLGIGVASLVVFCKSRDPARKGFQWLGPASLTLGIFAILDLAVILWFSLGYPSRKAYIQLNDVISFFCEIAYIQVFIVLVELTVGLHGVVIAAGNTTTTTTNKFRKVTRGCMFVTAGVMSILIVAEFIRSLAVAPRVPVPRNDRDILQALSNVRLAAHVICFVAFAAALGLVVSVFRLARKTHFVGDVHKLLLAAAVLLAVRALFYLGFDILAHLPFKMSGSGASFYEARMENLRRQYAVFVLQVIGDFVFAPIAVVLFFIAGRRKVGGLWADSQGGAATESGVGGVGKREKEHSPSA